MTNRLPRTDQGSSVTVGVPQLRRWVGRHQLALFFVLSFVVGWALLPVGTFIPAAPLVAALAVVALADGLPGLRRWGARLVRWRVGWRWYAVAVGVPLTVHAAVLAMHVAGGGAMPSWSAMPPVTTLLLLLGTRMVNPLDGPLGEEPGWRGYAQPGLQRRLSPLAATAVLAVVVTTWHVPLVLIPQFGLGPIDLVTTAAVTFWYAWLFNRTGGSALLTLIAHNVEGSFGQWAADTDAARFPVPSAVAYTALALALVLLDPSAWRRGTPDPRPHD